MALIDNGKIRFDDQDYEMRMLYGTGNNAPLGIIRARDHVRIDVVGEVLIPPPSKEAWHDFQVAWKKAFRKYILSSR